MGDRFYMKTYKTSAALFLAVTCLAGAAAAMSSVAKADGVRKSVSPFTVLCEKEAADAVAELDVDEKRLFREGYAQRLLFSSDFYKRKLVQSDLQECKEQSDWLGLQSKDQSPESLFASHEKALPGEVFGVGVSGGEGTADGASASGVSSSASANPGAVLKNI